MSKKIIAYEGSGSASSPISWGAAVLGDGKNLYNAITRFSVPISEFDSLLSDGHITKLMSPIEISAHHFAKQSYVLQVRDSKYRVLFDIDTGKAGGLIEHKHTKNDGYVYVFDSKEAFKRCSNVLANGIARKILDVEVLAEDSAELLKFGISLDCESPYLNAIRVLLAPVETRDKVREIARVSVPAEQQLTFDEFVDSLTNNVGTYRLHYKGGVTQGGGLDINVLEKLAKSLKKAHESIAGVLSQHSIFTGSQIPSPRLAELKSASADLHFKANLEHKTFFEKSARYLEIRTLEKILKGEDVGSLKEDTAFRKTVLDIVNLDEATQLFHTPIATEYGTEAEEPVAPNLGDDNAISWDTQVFTVLGFQSGLINDASEIEIQCYPNSNIKVSAKDNGGGKPPLGVEYLHEESDFLFRPLLFSLFRTDAARGKSKYSLVKVERIEAGHTYDFDSIPSTSVRGAYLLPEAAFVLHVERDDSFRIEHDRVERYMVERMNSKNNFDDAREWLKGFFDECFIVEIEEGISADWVRPAKVGRLNDSQRLVYTLGELGGEGEQSEVIDKFNELFDANKRDNNTRRIVIGDSRDIFRLDKKTNWFSLTARGESYYDLIRKLLGDGILEVK